VTPAALRPGVLDVFVLRPVLAVVISLLLVIAGLKAASGIPVLEFPRIESSSLVISTRYVGAPASVVQGFVTEPIERVASTVPGADYVDSSTTAGQSTVTVWLKLNENSTAALAELSARLGQIRYELPQGAEDPAVTVRRADRSGALFYLDVSTEDIPRAAVTDYLSRHVVPQMGSIAGVQRVSLEGGRNPAMRVWLDPAKLAAFDIGAEQVQAALLANNVIATIGETENSLQRVNLLADTTLQTVADFERLVLRESGGALLRLGDVARVELGEEEGEVDARHTQQQAVYLAVWPVPGANEIAIADDLYVVLERINAALPAGMHINTAYDATVYMRAAIREIFITLAETIVLVGIVVLALMGSVRTALVPLVAIPVSLLGAVAVITLADFSLNLLTILAIVLSVGLVVDDAIVVVENVSRYMRGGKTRLQAALASSRQLMAPIIGMTITLAAVYAPIGFLSGLTGVLFREFALTLAVAVLISGVVALTLSPIMSAYANPEGGREGPMARWVNSRFDALHRRYGQLLPRVLAWRAQILVAALLVSLLMVPFYLFSQKELAPIEDQSSINFVVDAPSSASLAYTNGYIHDVIEQALRIPGVDYIWQVVQPSSGYGGIELVEPEQRERSVHELLPETYANFAQVTGLRVFPLLSPALPSAGRFDVELVVQSAESPEEMKRHADALLEAAQASGRFLFADVDLKIDMPQHRLVLDRERIADLGLDLEAVSRQLGVLLSGDYVNRFDMHGKAYQVIPMLQDADRGNPEALLDLQLRTPAGALVPLAAIARLERTVAPRMLGKFQQKNAFRVLGGVLPGTTKEQGLAVLEKAAKSLPASYSIDYAGESRQIRQEGSTLTGILGFALLFVYFALVVQFNSFRDPLVVLAGSVPLALAGALMLPFLGLTTINIYSQIGCITLVGLVAKNGILIVEFANHLQAEGLGKLEAIRGAAETRLRPVLMTTAATVLGHFPLVLVTGAGAEARNSIGIVLVAGMLIGTLFTLFVLPCLYLVLAKSHASEDTDARQEGARVAAASYAS